MKADEVHSGGCQCGAIRYRIAGSMPQAYTCHCGECQKQSASAFSISISIAYDRIELTGEPAMFEVTGYSGAKKQCYFCPDCGSRLWHRSALSPDRATLKVGTLDNTAGIAPAFHLWVSRKQGWVMLDPEIPAYETQPDNLTELREHMKDRPQA